MSSTWQVRKAEGTFAELRSDPWLPVREATGRTKSSSRGSGSCHRHEVAHVIRMLLCVNEMHH